MSVVICQSFQVEPKNQVTEHPFNRNYYQLSIELRDKQRRRFNKNIIHSLQYSTIESIDFLSSIENERSANI